MREAGVSRRRVTPGRRLLPDALPGVRGIVMMLLARPAALLHWLA